MAHSYPLTGLVLKATRWVAHTRPKPDLSTPRHLSFLLRYCQGFLIESRHLRIRKVQGFYQEWLSNNLHVETDKSKKSSKSPQFKKPLLALRAALSLAP